MCVKGTVLDEQATLESILTLLRRELTQGIVKEEPGAVVPASGSGGSWQWCRSLNSHQMKLLRHIMRDAWRFDPARSQEAFRLFKHLLQQMDVDVLLRTVDGNPATFSDCRHKGERVGDLTMQLLSGQTRLQDIPPLVVVQVCGTSWVVFGNRRLKALKDYRVAVAEPVLTSCIVHSPDQGCVPNPLMAKFLASSMTMDLGTALAPWRRLMPAGRVH